MWSISSVARHNCCMISDIMILAAEMVLFRTAWFSRAGHCLFVYVISFLRIEAWHLFFLVPKLRDYSHQALFFISGKLAPVAGYKMLQRVSEKLDGDCKWSVTEAGHDVPPPLPGFDLLEV